MADPRYTREEVERILARAAQQERGEMEHAELLAAAAEAGLDPGAVAAAAKEIVARRELDEARTRRQARRKRKFFDHLRAYLVVNGALVLFDVLPDGGVDWFYWPLIGWGIGLVFDAIGRLGAEDPDEAERLDRKELGRLRKLRGKGTSMDFKLGPNVRVQVELPDEDELDARASRASRKSSRF